MNKKIIATSLPLTLREIELTLKRATILNPPIRFKSDQFETRIIKLLGEGSDGRVFAVQYDDTSYGAVKIMKKEIGLNELKNFYKLKSLDISDSVINVKKALTWGPTLLLFMDYCSNSLSTLLKKKDYTLADKKAHIRQVVTALKAINEKGLSFMDLKAENVLVSESGHIKLIDFARIAPHHSNYPDLKSAYHDPNSTISPQSDLFSLGFLIYEMMENTPLSKIRGGSNFESISELQLYIRPTRNLEKTTVDFIFKLCSGSYNKIQGIDAFYKKGESISNSYQQVLDDPFFEDVPDHISHERDYRNAMTLNPDKDDFLLRKLLNP